MKNPAAPFIPSLIPVNSFRLTFSTRGDVIERRVIAKSKGQAARLVRQYFDVRKIHTVEDVGLAYVPGKAA
jgi:hypothetical protein